MSSFYENIRASFDIQLDSAANAITPLPLPIAWQGTSFNPRTDANANGEYIAQFMLDIDTTASSLGDSGLDENLGVYQINIYIPKNKGNRINIICDKIADYFNTRVSLSYGGVSSYITELNRSPPQDDGKFDVAIIECFFQTFTQNRNL